MFLAALIRNDDGDTGALSHILNSFQPHLGHHTTTIDDLTLISHINLESSWNELIQNLELQGFTVLLVFEPNHSGRDEIFYPEPNPEDLENDPADEGVRALHVFHTRQHLLAQLQRNEARAKEAAAKAKRQAALKARRRNILRWKKAGRT